ncbi:hypothetical protein ADL27_41730, partial [Streptomyces sp. NRRL F-6602]
MADRFAEFTGWMAQESGHDEAARRWTDHAARLAFDGGDHQLGHYGLVRRALMAYYRGHAAETVALSAAAVSVSGPIAFIALTAPQIARRLTRGSGPHLLLSALTGALLLVAADCGLYAVPAGAP